MAWVNGHRKARNEKMGRENLNGQIIGAIFAAATRCLPTRHRCKLTKPEKRSTPYARTFLSSISCPPAEYLRIPRGDCG